MALTITIGYSFLRNLIIVLITNPAKRHDNNKNNKTAIPIPDCNGQCHIPFTIFISNIISSMFIRRWW